MTMAHMLEQVLASVFLSQQKTALGFLSIWSHQKHLLLCKKQEGWEKVARKIPEPKELPHEKKINLKKTNKLLSKLHY